MHLLILLPSCNLLLLLQKEKPFYLRSYNENVHIQEEDNLKHAHHKLILLGKQHLHLRKYEN